MEQVLPILTMNHCFSRIAHKTSLSGSKVYIKYKDHLDEEATVFEILQVATKDNSKEFLNGSKIILGFRGSFFLVKECNDELEEMYTTKILMVIWVLWHRNDPSDEFANGGSSTQQ